MAGVSFSGLLDRSLVGVTAKLHPKQFPDSTCSSDGMAAGEITED
jgi:hypothetical protein